MSCAPERRTDWPIDFFGDTRQAARSTSPKTPNQPPAPHGRAPNKIFPAQTTSPSDNNKSIAAAHSCLHLRGQQRIAAAPSCPIIFLSSPRPTSIGAVASCAAASFIRLRPRHQSVGTVHLSLISYISQLAPCQHPSFILIDGQSIGGVSYLPEHQSIGTFPSGCIPPFISGKQSTPRRPCYLSFSLGTPVFVE